jgi:hypothetical protein
MLDLNEFAKEVHAVAVEHGWWEGEENNDIDTKIALIHAEWSEALEEYRDGRPMVYVLSVEGDEEMTPRYETDADKFAGRKPEGIAVELVDGCIRIMDMMAHEGMKLYEADDLRPRNCTLPRLVTTLHYCTSNVVDHVNNSGKWIRNGLDVVGNDFNCCLTTAMAWLDDQGVDMDEILRLKHEYNKTRERLHGKLF